MPSASQVCYSWGKNFLCQPSRFTFEWKYHLPGKYLTLARKKFVGQAQYSSVKNATCQPSTLLLDEKCHMPAQYVTLEWKCYLPAK
jgi:hypothetical protein